MAETKVVIIFKIKRQGGQEVCTQNGDRRAQRLRKGGRECGWGIARLHTTTCVKAMDGKHGGREGYGGRMNFGSGMNKLETREGK